MPTPFLDQIATLFARGRRIAEPADALSQFRRTIERARADLPTAGLDEPSAALARQTLERVTRIAAAYTPERIEEEAARLYRAAADFHSDLLLLLALTSNPAAARELLAMRAYVEQAAVPSAPPLPDTQELTIDRAVILERLSYAVPVETPHQIESLRADFNLFHRRYERVYLHHHLDYHRTLEALQNTLPGARASLEALALLNDITELGAPVGADLGDRLAALLAPVRPCGLGEQALRAALATSPLCPACRLSLDAQPPIAAVAQWQRDLDAALRTQQRRLAQAVVRRAIADSRRPALDRFLRAVRAGDLAPLVEVMDPEVVALIREVLTRPA